MSDNRAIHIDGAGFLSRLTVAFIVLKLTKYISWSWWWVLSPIWIPLLLATILLSAGVAIAAVNRSNK